MLRERQSQPWQWVNTSAAILGPKSPLSVGSLVTAGPFLRIKQHPINYACNKLTILSTHIYPVANVPVTTRILTFFQYGTPYETSFATFTLDLFKANLYGLRCSWDFHHHEKSSPNLPGIKTVTNKYPSYWEIPNKQKPWKPNWGHGCFGLEFFRPCFGWRGGLTLQKMEEELELQGCKSRPTAKDDTREVISYLATWRIS